MSKSKLIDVYDLCPCGSGAKYRFCCYKKQDQEFHSGKEIRAHMMKTAKDVAFCFYKNDSCTEEIIRAHSIQRSGILKKLAVDNHVYMIGPKNDEFFGAGLDLCGIKKDATTARCFCKYHDTEIFKSIEASPYSGTDQQKFLYGYRAFAKFFHAKMVERNQLQAAFRAIPHEMLNSPLFPRLRGICTTIKELDSVRECLNRALDVQDYGFIETISFSLDYEVDFAVSYACPLCFDLMGNELNNVWSDTDVMKNICVSIFPASGLTHILIGWLRDDHDFFSVFKEQFITLRAYEELFIRVLNNMIACQCDNFVLSPRMVDNWTDEERKAFLVEFMAIGFGIGKIKNLGMLIEQNLVEFPCKFDLFKPSPVQ